MADIQPYDASPRQFAENVYLWDGEWYGIPFRRRMTVIRLETGGLFVHSPIRVRDDDFGKLDELGPVQVIVAPNAFHADDAPYYRLRYPKAKLHVPAAIAKKVAKKHLCPVDGTLPCSNEPWNREIDCLEFQGTRLLHETVFYYRPGRLLLATDLVFNMRSEVHGMHKLIGKLNKCHHRFGPTRLFRHVIVNDLNRAKGSLARILSWDIDKVVMSHGTPLASGGHQAIVQGFREMGL